MQSTIRATISKTSYWYLLPVTIAAFYLFHFTNQNNDYPVFMKAGSDFLSRRDPWAEFANPAAMYLNGPSTLPIYAIFSIFPMQASILALRILNLALTAMAISRYSSLKSPLVRSALISTVFLSSPFRATMEYGQFTIIFGLLAYLIFRRLQSNFGSNFVTALALVLSLEYKPNIFGILLLVALILRRYLILLWAVVIFTSIEILIGIWIDSRIPLVSWLNAISYRSRFTSQSEDNVSLSSKIGLVPMILITCLILLVLFLARYFPKKIASHNSLVFLIGLYLLVTPLMHPTDFYLLVLFLVFEKKFNLDSLTLLGMLMVWSPTVSGGGFAIFFGSIALLLLIKLHSLPIWYVLIFNTPNIAYLILVRLGFDEPSIRHFWQVAFILFSTFRALSFQKKLSVEA